jgi:hypothetical protein
VIEGRHLLDSLRRVASGEDPDLVYAELWANAEREQISPDEVRCHAEIPDKEIINGDVAVLRELARAIIARDENIAAARTEILAEWKKHLDEADASDEDGSHVGFATHHRAVASGLAEAASILSRYFRA